MSDRLKKTGNPHPAMGARREVWFQVSDFGCRESWILDAGCRILVAGKYQVESRRVMVAGKIGIQVFRRGPLACGEPV